MSRGAELPQLMAGSAAGQLAGARLPPRGLPPQPRGAGAPRAGRPGLLSAQQPGGACLHLPTAQHRCHPACMYGHLPNHPPACCPCSLALPLPTWESIEWGGRSKGTQIQEDRGQRETQRNVRDSHPGDGQGGGRTPRRQTVTWRPQSLGSAQPQTHLWQMGLRTLEEGGKGGKAGQMAGKRGIQDLQASQQERVGGAGPERVRHGPCARVL